MKKRINNKGFTLVELLAVLVILGAIMGMAIPSITSSLERSKEKQNQSKIKMIESYAELYVNDHKNTIYNNLGSNGSCHIPINILKDNGYLTDDAAKNVDGEDIPGSIIFNKKENTYTYISTVPGGIASCI